MEDANLCAIHAKLVTVMPGDLDLARRIRSDLPRHEFALRDCGAYSSITYANLSMLNLALLINQGIYY